MEKLFKYGVACSLNDVSEEAPIILRGSIEELCSQAKEIGYDGLEIQLANPAQYDWDMIGKTAKDYGLEIVCFATGRELGENGLSLISFDSAVRRAAIDRLKEHIDYAKKVGAMVIVGSMRTKITDWSRKDECLDYHREAVLELADYAKSQGVEIIIENILQVISNYLNTMREVTDFVRGLGKDNVGVHLDTYSMLMEDNDIRKSVEYCAKELVYVHFADSARWYPGGGNVDFKAHMHALLDVGYHGYITTECVPRPTAYLCAKYGYDYCQALEQLVRIERTANRFA